MYTHDVVIVGASVAGCATAILYARAGLSVALIERNAGWTAYKKLCTHYIQSSALPIIERLGLARSLEDCGAVRNALDLHTRWGWIHEGEPAPGQPTHGYNLRRNRLDPLLRDLAARTPGIEMLLGHTASGLNTEHGRIAALHVVKPSGASYILRARLLVGADGRHSQLARWAAVPTRETPNMRFFYYAQFRGLDQNKGRSRMWMGETGVAYTFPNEDGITVAAVALPKDLLPQFKADLEGSLTDYLRRLPGGPDLGAAERVGPIMGFIDMPNVSRRPAVPGLALVGDAALSVDPLWGSGCAWALQSAAWLVDSTAAALGASHGIDRAARAYARRHYRALAGHAWHISSYARGRRWWLPERLMIESAALDQGCANHLFAYSTRNISLARFMSPIALARASSVVLRAQISGDRPRLHPEPEAAGYLSRKIPGSG